MIIPFVDVLKKVSLRVVTMPIQSQGIITRDNVSIDVAAVAYYRVVDAVKSVMAVENVSAAINQIAQTTLRNVVGQHTLDEILSETDAININIREILDVATGEWGVVVTLVELKDIQLPDSMKRAMARQAEAEREKRAKIIAAEGESVAAAALGDASDIMMEHPLALQLRNLQSLVEIGVDKNTTVVFPAPLMSTIGDLGAFLPRETDAADSPPGWASRPGAGPPPGRRHGWPRWPVGSHREADPARRREGTGARPPLGLCALCAVRRRGCWRRCRQSREERAVLRPRDLLNRFRQSGAPGAAGGTGVPAEGGPSRPRSWRGSSPSSRSPAAVPGAA